MKSRLRLRREMSWDWKGGYFRASWDANVGKMSWRLLRSSKLLEQKNDAPKRPLANALSAIVRAIVDFPVPASPLSQKTGVAECSIQSSISLSTLPRVPFRQPLRFPC